MSTLKDKIIRSFKWKKNSEYCSKKLNITIDEYNKLKSEILLERKSKFKVDIKHNVEDGEITYSAISHKEPKTAEEIIKLLKIDTTKWKLSQFWNKQMSDHWRVSALVTKLKETDVNYLEHLVKTWKPKRHKIPKFINQKLPDKIKVCGILSLQDIHFGKEGNYTIDKDFENTITNLISRATPSHHIDTLYYIVGGDLINMDTFFGTTTNGTPVNNSMKATEAYVAAFNAIHWAISLLVEHCDKLVVVYIPGNHDRLSSYHLVHALSKSIDTNKIEWDIEYAERKVHVYGDNFNAFEHGDSMSKNTPLVYATEFSNDWGKTKHRTLFTGHFHKNKKVEYITTNEDVGFIHKTLPSLSRSDYWHYHKKYVCNKRSGKLELQSPDKGNICELTYTAE